MLRSINLVQFLSSIFCSEYQYVVKNGASWYASSIILRWLRCQSISFVIKISLRFFLKTGLLTGTVSQVVPSLVLILFLLSNLSFTNWISSRKTNVSHDWIFLKKPKSFKIDCIWLVNFSWSLIFFRKLLK